MLGPGAYRGVVLTLLVGKTFEHVLLQRMLRWLRAKGALPSRQAVSSGSATSHLVLHNETLALRTARRGAYLRRCGEYCQGAPLYAGVALIA